MITMNRMNGIRPAPSYVIPPEFTNNNYLTGSPATLNNNNNNTQTLQGAAGAFHNDIQTLQGPFSSNVQSPQVPPHAAFGNSLQAVQGPSQNFDCSQSAVYATSDLGVPEGNSMGDYTESSMGNCADETVLDLNGENSVFIQGSNCVYNTGTGQQSANCMNSQVPNSLTVGGGHFTFTSPTQSIYYSPSITSYTGTRYLQPRTMPHVFAPTSCLQWQHSVPLRIPWSACGPTAREQDILKFKGKDSSGSAVTFTNQYDPVCSVSQTYSPIPSCSHPPRRLKRSAPDSLSNPPFNRKVHLTEAMISKHMQGLQIENGTSKTHPGCPNSSQPVTNASPGQKQQQRWENFRDLEDRLCLSDEDEDSGIDEGQPRLHMADDIAKMVKSQPVIPKEILDKMSKPRMELVLWQPPGGGIRDLIESNNTSSQIDESRNISEPHGVQLENRHNLGIHSLPPSVPESMEEDGIMDIDTNDGNYTLYCS